MNPAYYLWRLLALTTRHTGRLVLAARRGEPDVAGSTYDAAPADWARDLLAETRIEVRAEGLEHLAGLGPCVFASNHTSFVDIWALLATLPGRVRFVAKRELFPIPIFGTALRITGQIPIDRQQRHAAIASCSLAAQAIRGGKSAIVFVEGTRSRDGTLRPFKKGAFVLALEAQVPVVPVRILGAYERLPRGAVAPRPGQVIVRVGAPVATAGLGYDAREALLERTRAAVEALADAPGVDGVQVAG